MNPLQSFYVESLPEDISAEYGAADHLIIEGIVSPKSQSIYKFREKITIHSFSLEVWQPVGGACNETNLSIVRTLPFNADEFDKFPKYAILKLKVFMTPSKERVLLDTVLPMDVKNKELERLVEILEKPVIVSTELFGDLTLDKRFDIFEGEGMWINHKVKVRIPLRNKSIENELKTAASVWSEKVAWEDKAKEYAVKELLPIKNEHWLSEGEVEMTTDEFKKLMDLESVTFEKDIQIQFWYNDGDIFWGHSIGVSANLNDGPDYADF